MNQNQQFEDAVTALSFAKQGLDPARYANQLTGDEVSSH